MRQHAATPTAQTRQAEAMELDAITHAWIDRIGRRIAAVEATKERDCE